MYCTNKIEEQTQNQLNLAEECFTNITVIDAAKSLGKNVSHKPRTLLAIQASKIMWTILKTTMVNILKLYCSDYEQTETVYQQYHAAYMGAIHKKLSHILHIMGYNTNMFSYMLVNLTKKR